jgi:hypothetical protein
MVPEQPVGDSKELESGVLEYQFGGENSPALKVFLAQTVTLLTPRTYVLGQRPCLVGA